MRIMKSPLTSGIAAVVAIAIGTTATASVTGPDASVKTETGTRVTTPPPRKAVDVVPSDQASLGVLRRDRQSGDELPTKAQRILGERPSEGGENFALSKRALVTTTGTSYFVIPGNGLVCMRTERANGACATPDHINSGNFTGLEICGADIPPGAVRVNGMLPDSASNAEVHFASGRVEAVLVKNNVYAFDAPATGDVPVSLSWTGDGKEHRVEVSVPSDASKGCGPQTPE